MDETRYRTQVRYNYLKQDLYNWTFKEKTYIYIYIQMMFWLKKGLNKMFRGFEIANC